MDMSLKRKLSEIDGSSANSSRKRQLVDDDPNKIRIGSRKSQVCVIFFFCV